jgi:signal transduction histidine kinase
MTLRARLTLAILAIALVLCIPLLFALRSLEELHVYAAQLRDYEFAGSLLLGRISVGTEDLRRAEDALVVVHDSASRARMSRVLAGLDAQADSLEGFGLDSAAYNVRAAISDIARLAPTEYAAARAHRGALADSVSTHGSRVAISRMDGWIDDAERALRERTRSRVDSAAAKAEHARQFAIGVLGFAAILALAIAVWITRSVSQPVSDLEAGMRAVSEGDFSYTLSIAPSRRDEFGRLSASYASMSMQLAELDKLKAEFVSVASHEIRTPVNVLLGYLQLLQEGVYGELSDKQMEVCRTLEQQCHALGRLVRQLLDVSRFEAGGGKLDVRRISLFAFLDELETAFQVLALQRGVEFVVRRSVTLPQTVFWDPDRMSEVLGNLLSNAFKFTPRGGQVSLRVDASDDGIVHMQVRDTGAGIAAEQLPRIFDKFYRADNQQIDNSEGTGLGLAIAKTIVEAHTGSIAVDSRIGVGTTFTIDLPAIFPLPRRHRAALMQPAAGPSPAPSVESVPERVLS